MKHQIAVIFSPILRLKDDRRRKLLKVSTNGFMNFPHLEKGPPKNDLLFDEMALFASMTQQQFPTRHCFFWRQIYLRSPGKSFSHLARSPSFLPLFCLHQHALFVGSFYLAPASGRVKAANTSLTRLSDPITNRVQINSGNVIRQERP